MLLGPRQAGFGATGTFRRRIPLTRLSKRARAVTQAASPLLDAEAGKFCHRPANCQMRKWRLL